MRFCTLLILLGFFNSILLSQESNSSCEKFESVLHVFNQNYVEPENLNYVDIEAFRSSLIQTLDPKYIIFSEEDFSQLATIGNSLNIDKKKAYCEDLEVLTGLIEEGIASSIEILEGLKNTPFDFSENDSIYLGSTYYPDYYRLSQEKRLVLNIKSRLVGEFLIKSYRENISSEVLDSLLLQFDSLKVREVETMKKMLLEKQSDGISQMVFNAYINSLLFQFDKYSHVFSEESFDQFKNELSTSSKSLGIILEDFVDGQMIISSVIPGSFAWRCGKIKDGDILLKLKKEDKDTLIIKDASIFEISAYFSSVSESGLTLTLQKLDREIVDVRIYDEENDMAQNVAQSALLSGDIKVGYISLPAFYTSWEGEELKGCAQDIGKIIYSLKKEGISSLILDLRNNGGGAIKEALDLAGLFIDFGALVIEQNRYVKFHSLKDFNRGIMYSGPVAVLVNRGSASASELFAAVLQDYNRAIIIGDTTFGKATGQIILPADEKGKLMLKVTTLKMFRVSGESYHTSGVIPDIILPNMRDPMRANKEFVEGYDPIDAKFHHVYFNPLQALPIDLLRRKSISRIIISPKFQVIDNANLLARGEFLSKNYLQLDRASCHRYVDKTKQVFTELSYFDEHPVDIYTTDFLQKDKDLASAHKYFSDIQRDFKKTISTDIYIEECYNILYDYVKIEK